jgi:hypothetical protein
MKKKFFSMNDSALRTENAKMDKLTLDEIVHDFLVFDNIQAGKQIGCEAECRKDWSGIQGHLQGFESIVVRVVKATAQCIRYLGISNQICL